MNQNPETPSAVPDVKEEEKHGNHSDGYCNVCSRPMRPVEGEDERICICLGIQPYAMSCYPGEYQLVKTHPGNDDEQWYKRSEIDPLLLEKKEAVAESVADKNLGEQGAVSGLRDVQGQTELPLQDRVAIEVSWCRHANLTPHETARRVIAMLQEPKQGHDIEEMVSRFLAWPLPESVCSDDCATMSGYPNRVGTNLLSAPEARKMIEYLLDAPSVPEGTKSDAATGASSQNSAPSSSSANAQRPIKAEKWEIRREEGFVWLEDEVEALTNARSDVGSLYDDLKTIRDAHNASIRRLASLIKEQPAAENLKEPKATI